MGIMSRTAPAHDTAQQPDHDYRAMAAFGRRSTVRLNSSRAIAAAVAGSVAAAYLAGGRSWQLRWGATGEEARAALLGDDLIPAPDLTATRAVTIHAPAVLIWPWIAQLGQGRGGFYTYDWLENLLGLDMRSADHVVSEWQDIRAGYQIRLAADVGLAVAIAEQGRALVIRGGIPMGRSRARTTSPGAGSCGRRKTGQHGWWCVNDMPTRVDGRRSSSSQFSSSVS